MNWLGESTSFPHDSTENLTMHNDVALSVDSAAVLAHYERVADTIAAHFYGTPIITLFEPDKDRDPVIQVGQLHHPVPAHAP